MRLLLPLLPFLPACVLVVDDGEPQVPSENGPSRIVAAGVSFGECWGYCGHDLDFYGDEVIATHVAWGDADPPADIVNRGALTDAGSDELAAIADELADVELAEFYGCPDCGDGGAASVALVVGDQASGTTWDYIDTPEFLAGVREVVLEDVRMALTRCESTARVTVLDCTPVP